MLGIGAHAFEDGLFTHRSFEYVRIPEGVWEIGPYAFHCRNLREVEIPESVEIIGNEAFSTSDLLTVRIPKGVKKIGDNAFSYCSQLREVEIPDSVIEIPDWAFKSCENLAEVKAHDGIKRIGFSAFGECKSIKHIDFGMGACAEKELKLPKNLAEIGSLAFDRTNITAITISKWTKVKGVGFISGLYTDQKCRLSYYEE